MGNVMGKLSASHKWALGLVLFTTVTILAGVNWRIFKFEQLLNHGQVVRFALAPVDPRSLMQGDYMALEYAIARDVRSALAPQQMQGQLLLAVDGQKVARFVDFYTDQALGKDQLRVQFRVRGNQIKLASNSFFFEEGQADHFSEAKYGEFRVNLQGELLLVSLLDEKLQPL
ncbi:GDYXXLXY domain-containing protein [Shewanella oncorhynchi]|uniref:GDYXXLXY domain-containing protein n=1 Tax=Shewanella TaxID=22 RepID=UPI0021DB48F0|nr:MULTISPECIES: GDYXXLXY domain-containing protein [unclassified Shewanella]MCU7965164.1 GDYXXLXY domain-containing protein [Shewanella sp. SW32]MCU7973154.1 GDYXXLXY domain-containing protein [Shewanella sp. SW29]